MTSNEDHEDTPRGEGGNIICKSIILLCLGIFIIWIGLTLYDFLTLMTYTTLPSLDPFIIIIFLVGFVFGWAAREATKN
ncbi:MAG: hypothetical protein ACFFEF_18145 [Candidatus Thorarchaeota archaeon]